MDPNDSDRFPCKAYPEEKRSLRLLGLYDMRQEGLVMQRVKVPSGRITLAQWRRLAEIAAEHTPGYPLHVTTRQNVELHGLRSGQVPAVHQALDEVGMTTLRTAGDTLRNITCCPGSGLCADSVDVLPLADAITAACEALPWLHDLPRKFKTCLSGCKQACARPYIHCVGFVARPDGGFDATVGGSLGARPGTGIPFSRPLRLNEVVPLLIAAIKLFNAEGDRENRKRARLRHVRERVGDEPFLAELTRLFEAELNGDVGTAPALSPPPDETRHLGTLHLPLGDISAADALSLADGLGAAGAELRIGIGHDLRFYGRTEPDLPAGLASLAGGAQVVACPGATWCEFGIGNSRAAAASLVEEDVIPAGIEVCASGCPNSCAHAAIADIGLIGRIKTVAGERVECFRLLAGGGKGVAPALAEELHSAVPAADLPRAVAFLSKQYEERTGDRSVSFGDFVRGRKAELAADIAALVGGE